MLRRHFISCVHLFAATAIFPAHADAYDDFFKAVELDDSSTVGRLLLRGFDPNAIDRRGRSAIVFALVSDSARAFELLIAHPETRVDAANAAGETPLMMAALRGNLGAVRSLIERGAQINRPGWSPLHYAASGPEPKVLQLLLERGADIDARAPNGNTPLMMAARYGAVDGAQVLLSRGADPRLRNAAGMTAADLARVAERDRLADRLERAAR